MKKEIKFVDGIQGFIYDGIHGFVTKIFREPISESEVKGIEKMLGDQDMFFRVGDEKDIIEMWEIDKNEIDINKLDINSNEMILEWKK